MSTRRVEKRGKAAGRDESGALYLYCIGTAPSLSALLKEKMPAPIEEGGAFELLEAEGLAAVASRVALKDYDEDALSSHLTDAAWMALRAMRHERVVDFFAKRASIVPLRFGVIFVERAGVLKMLAERAEELRAALTRLAGREEWGVNVFCDRKRLMEAIASLSPRLKELNAEAQAASPGQAYLVRKKMESLRNTEARAEVKRTVERLEEVLNERSAGATRLRLLKDEAGEEGELVGKLAFLVERARFEEFRAAAERLAHEYEGAGFRLELTGPWPAYNFVLSS